MSCPCCGGADHTSSNASPPPCPGCGEPGEWVERVTPRHTLLAPLRAMVMAARRYAFCPTPGCEVVYYSDDLQQRFLGDDLLHPVTVKSDTPETPLCYCFKERKGEVRGEIERTGASGVIARIEAKMAERGCFCEKSNPRGVCCLEAVKGWLDGERKSR